MMWTLLNINKLITLLFLISSIAHASESEPEKTTYTNSSLNLTFIGNSESTIDIFSIRLENQFQENSSGLTYTKYKKSSFLNYGAAVDLSYLERHHDDWQNIDGTWDWYQTKQVAPSLLLKTYKNIRLVNAVPLYSKVRAFLKQDFLHEQQSFGFDLGLSYFFFGNSAPEYSVHIFFPQVYDNREDGTALTDSASYIDFFIHSKKWIYAFGLKQGTKYWDSSKNFRDKNPDNSYNIANSYSYLSFKLIYQH